LCGGILLQDGCKFFDVCKKGIGYILIQDRNLNACLFIYEGVYFEKRYSPIYRAKPVLKGTSK
jgi:hypothetical protein